MKSKGGKRLRVLFNCSTNFIGGAVQNATNFIRQSLENPAGIEWHYAVSSEVKKQLDGLGCSTDNDLVFSSSPSRDLKAREKLKEYAKEREFDLVFTMAGPAYVSFPSKHLLGCSNPYITHPNSFAIKSQGKNWDVLLFRLRIMYASKWFKKANYWIFQTETSRAGFIHNLRVERSKTFVVPNASSDVYTLSSKRGKRDLSQLKILVPSAYYKHKNLEIIPYVAQILKERITSKDRKREFKFILTLPADLKPLGKINKRAEALGVADTIENNGPFLICEGPHLYENCTIMFLPTLLETFSASYLEAMAMDVPIVTTDMDFSREICGAAAEYFQPTSAEDAANAILRLWDNPERIETITLLGRDQLRKFPSAKDRYENIVYILKSLT